MHSGNTSQNNAVAVHLEALRLMDMWRNDVAPDVIAKCRRHHSTQLALAEMQSGATFFHGLSRLWRDGSVMSQLLRPFYFVFHLVRRSLVTPYWKNPSA